MVPGVWCFTQSGHRLQFVACLHELQLLVDLCFCCQIAAMVHVSPAGQVAQACYPPSWVCAFFRRNVFCVYVLQGKLHMQVMHTIQFCSFSAHVLCMYLAHQHVLCMLSLQGKLYPHALQVDDISSDVPLQLLAGGYYIGGYGIVSSHVYSCSQQQAVQPHVVAVFGCCC